MQLQRKGRKITKCFAAGKGRTHRHGGGCHQATYFCESSFPEKLFGTGSIIASSLYPNSYLAFVSINVQTKGTYKLSCIFCKLCQSDEWNAF